MHFTLIVTSFKNDEQLVRLFDSLSRQSSFNHIIHLIYVNQNNFKTSLPLKDSIFLTEILTSRLSLSKARNTGLQECGVTDILAFPDDDCWYSDGIFDSVCEYFNVSNISNVNTNVYDPLLGKYYGSRTKKRVTIDSINIYFLPISVGIFVRFSDFSNARFNENFGVGSKYGCGEETLYLIEGGVVEKGGVYDGSLSVFHEVEDEGSADYLKIKTYSYGFGAMIRESFRLNSLGSLVSILTLFVRSTGACFLFLLKGDTSKALLYFYRSVYAFKGFLFK
jgi:hypothetical protein